MKRLHLNTLTGQKIVIHPFAGAPQFFRLLSKWDTNHTGFSARSGVKNDNVLYLDNSSAIGILEGNPAISF